MVRTEVKMFVYGRGERSLLPKGWSPVNMETDRGTLYVFAQKQQLMEPEEPTPGLKPDDDNTDALKSVGMGG